MQGFSLLEKVPIKILVNQMPLKYTNIRFQTAVAYNEISFIIFSKATALVAFLKNLGF